MNQKRKAQSHEPQKKADKDKAGEWLCCAHSGSQSSKDHHEADADEIVH